MPLLLGVSVQAFRRDGFPRRSRVKAARDRGTGRCPPGRSLRRIGRDGAGGRRPRGGPRATAGQLRELSRARLGRRATPVVIVVLWGRDRAAICGWSEESLTVHTDLDRDQVERVCSAAHAPGCGAGRSAVTSSARRSTTGPSCGSSPLDSGDIVHDTLWWSGWGWRLSKTGSSKG